MTIFIFGFGQVSKELAKRLSNIKNVNFKIVSRNTENFLNYAFLKLNFFKKNKLLFYKYSDGSVKKVINH